MNPAAPPAGGQPVPQWTHCATIRDADDAMTSLLMQAFTGGDQPWMRSSAISRVRDPAPTLLAPPFRQDARLRLSAGTRRGVNQLITGDSWTLYWYGRPGQSGSIQVTATSDALAKEVLDAATAAVRDTTEDTSDRLKMAFWYTSTYPERLRRPIDVPSWSTIHRNYTAPAAAALQKLMATTDDAVTGRILLLHGPAGTGKTTALRALASEWRSWCDVECVLDPEQLLGSTGYLMHVVLNGGDDEDLPPQPGAAAGEEHGRWRLLILEDCDELIRAEARSTAGQSLSRLLNLTDGIVGQGQRLIVAITTNEPLASLHPAIIRPGRCLAQIDVGRLTPEEATAWLDTGETITDPMGLAELYARRDGTAVTATDTTDAAQADGIGQYL